ncbi:MAG: hypothetical protein KAT04_15405 [Methylococcales bacterium]|nr:hypothetical protein [Methylococcales bacterium]
MLDQEWKPYNSTCGDRAGMPEIFQYVEFLVGEDYPNGKCKKGDIVKTSEGLQNTSFFSHWRPLYPDF